MSHFIESKNTVMNTENRVIINVRPHYAFFWHLMDALQVAGDEHFYDERDRLLQHFVEGHMYGVSEGEEGVPAFLCYHPQRPWECMLWVAPSHRLKGYGSFLVREYGQRHGDIRRVEALSTSIPFWQHNGYEVEAQHDGVADMIKT